MLTPLQASFLLGACLFLVEPVAAQVNGAIYTTDNRARIENNFNGKKAVYLAGGPGPNSGCTGNGLADGLYYFQVTDPSGAVLLSSDPLSVRAVVVINGVITSAPGGHSTRNGPCGSRIVSVYPFDNSPSFGSEYKLWLIPAASWVPGGPNHGFPSNRSKTDNFKVRNGGPPVEQALIQGTVFYDIDNDGIYDPAVPGEVPIPGWRVDIDTGGVVEVTYTDVDGHYEYLRDVYTAHDLASIAPAPGYVGTPGGRWAPTTPTEASVIAVPPVTTVDFGKLFMVFAPELSRSKGYWHNQGEAELAACDPLWRSVVNGLCLRDNFTVPFPPPSPDPTLFTVSETADFQTAFAQLSGYLVDPVYGILANSLSVQYCAANLNVSCGPMAGRVVYIDRQFNDVLVSLETMSAQTLGLLCDPRSCDTGPDGDPVWRAVVQGCLLEWSGMNNGENSYSASGEPPDVNAGY